MVTRFRSWLWSMRTAYVRFSQRISFHAKPNMNGLKSKWICTSFMRHGSHHIAVRIDFVISLVFVPRIEWTHTIWIAGIRERRRTTIHTQWLRWRFHLNWSNTRTRLEYLSKKFCSNSRKSGLFVEIQLIFAVCIIQKHPSQVNTVMKSKPNLAKLVLRWNPTPLYRRTRGWHTILSFQYGFWYAYTELRRLNNEHVNVCANVSPGALSLHSNRQWLYVYNCIYQSISVRERRHIKCIKWYKMTLWGFTRKYSFRFGFENWKKKWISWLSNVLQYTFRTQYQNTQYRWEIEMNAREIEQNECCPCVSDSFTISLIKRECIQYGSSWMKCERQKAIQKQQSNDALFVFAFSNGIWCAHGMLKTFPSNCCLFTQPNIIIFSLPFLFVSFSAAHREMRTITNYFLLNLSIADLLMSSLNCMFNFIYMLNSDWPFGSFYCRVNNFMGNVTVATSVFTLVAISFDR